MQIFMAQLLLLVLQNTDVSSKNMPTYEPPPPPPLSRCTILLDALRDGIVLVDAEGIVQLINKSARGMYAGGEAPLVGYPLSDFNAADWVEVKRVLTSGTALEGQRLSLPAAEVLVNRVPLHSQGQVTGVLCSFHPLAESNAHVRHLPAYQRLVEDLDALLDQPGTGMVLMDAQGRVRNVNSCFETFTRQERESLLGLPVSSLVERDSTGVFAALLECVEKEAPVILRGVAAEGRAICCVASPSFGGGELRFALARVLDCEATAQLVFPAGHAPGSDAAASVQGADNAASAGLSEGSDGILALARSHGIVLKSRSMVQLVQKMGRVAQTESSVLLQGESGAGKSVFASFIHKLSLRADKAFVAINCGAIPESLMESELFGYERGAFTGADPKGKVGLLEAGHGGTVFLDEIGELPMPMQVKLLEAIDKKVFMRVGGTRTIRVDMRIIAATNRVLEEEVSRGNFRKDLYYRLNVIPLTIPPLRERPEDIMAVAMDYLMRQNALRGEKKRLTPEVLELLVHHPFYGNMRELLNTLEWLVVMSDGNTLTPGELPMSFTAVMEPEPPQGARVATPPDRVPESPPLSPLRGGTLKDAVQLAEKQCIEYALSQYETLFEAAQALKVHPTTLWRKMGQLHITQEKTP